MPKGISLEHAHARRTPAIVAFTSTLWNWHYVTCMLRYTLSMQVLEIHDHTATAAALCFAARMSVVNRFTPCTTLSTIRGWKRRCTSHGFPSVSLTLLYYFSAKQLHCSSPSNTICKCPVHRQDLQHLFPVVAPLQLRSQKDSISIISSFKFLTQQHDWRLIPQLPFSK